MHRRTGPHTPRPLTLTRPPRARTRTPRSPPRAHAGPAVRRGAGRARARVPSRARPGEGAARGSRLALELFAGSRAARRSEGARPARTGRPGGRAPRVTTAPASRARPGRAPWTQRRAAAARRTTAWTRAPRPEGELSVEEAQDPFLVSIHIIADPGESQPLQEAIDNVLAWIHPDLPLFRVSERRASRRRRKPPKGAQPALAVVLFLQEEYGEEQILQLHRTLQQPPWRHHHTEQVHGRFLPYLPCSQDFFTLAPGTPLWAIRPVHYGKEIVRFTVYCRYDNYADSLRFYQLILRRSPSQKKADFCIFPIFSNLDVDIQFSLKRLPCDQCPVPTDSSVLEFRVRDIGELVPLLPNPCSPISEGRWQTEDHDGNKILLQAQRAHKKFPKPGRVHHASEKKRHSTPLPSTAVPSHTPGSSQQSPLNSPHPGPIRTGLPPGHQQEFAGRANSTPNPPWSFQRSKSLFCLPTGGPSLASSAEPQWFSNTGAPGHRASEWRHGHLLSIDDLEGAQETDVDTGLRLSSSDLSVVSAYSAPSRFCSTVETPIPSERCSSHWAAHKDSREGPLPTVSRVTTEASWASLPFFTKRSSSSSATARAAPPAPSTSTLTDSSPQLPCDTPKVKQTDGDMPPPPGSAGPGDNDMEEFYI
ncbi:protein FAM124A isoform X1 [Pan paniscus]|uniref:protein FAM124A isoform X1 n=1 Tax=Pan paniscus TaxID=9597 RepID=UPI003006AD6B